MKQTRTYILYNAIHSHLPQKKNSLGNISHRQISPVYSASSENQEEVDKWVCVSVFM